MPGPYRPKPSGPRPPMGRKPDPRQQKDEFELRINEAITAPQVRLVGDNIPEQGVYPLQKAIRLADDLELDLVEISAKADPPVCRIMDYEKYIYQQKKKAKEMKSNSAKIVVKEIRFGPNTDEHDFQFKLKHAQEFLLEGNKVRAYVFFRGRSILFKEQGEVLLLRFANDLEEYGKVESMPALEGKKMFLYLAPKKAGVAKKSQQKRDREAEEAKGSASGVAEVEEAPKDGGLFGNAKNGAEALQKLQRD